MIFPRREKKFGRRDLTLDEAAAFNTLERFGWDVWFIRNEDGQRTVVMQQGKTTIGALIDGEWVEHPEIRLRGQGHGDG